MFLCHTEIFSNTNRTNHTNEGAQTWFYHTDITDFTDICSNTNFTNKLRFPSFFEFLDILSVATKKPAHYARTQHADGCKIGCKIMRANSLIMSAGCKKCKILAGLCQ